MSQVCDITGAKPMHGNNVSHANNKTKRIFSINLHWKKVWVEEISDFIRLRTTSKGLRIIDKIGVIEALSRSTSVRAKTHLARILKTQKSKTEE